MRYTNLRLTYLLPIVYYYSLDGSAVMPTFLILYYDSVGGSTSVSALPSDPSLTKLS